MKKLKFPTAQTILMIIAGFITLLCLVFAGCSSAPTLMPTPNIYLSGSFPVNPITPGQQTQDLKLLYVTDRAPESDKSGKLVYGANRSASMAWGEVDVRLGTEPLEWSELLQISSSQSTAKRPRYVMNSIEESGRFAVDILWVGDGVEGE